MALKIVIDNVACEAEKYIISNDESVAVFLQTGYYECMEFEKDRHVGKVESFSKVLITSTSESEVRVLSVRFLG